MIHAGDGLRALPWSLDLQLSGSNARHLIVRVAKDAAFPHHALIDAGVEIPTDFGVFYAHPKRLAQECDLSLRTVRRIIKSLVACGVLLREKNANFLLEHGLVRAKRHNLPVPYYANTRIDGRDAEWLREASFVALALITAGGKPATPGSKKTPAGRDLADYGNDLVTAMRELVPADVWPDGYGPEDALYQLEAVGADEATTTGDEPQEATLDVDLGGWESAHVGNQPHDTTQVTLPGAEVTHLSDRLAERDTRKKQQAADRQSQADLNKRISGIVWTFRTRRHDRGLGVPDEKDSTWWRKMRALVKALLVDGAPDSAIVEALLQTGVHSPLEWQVRTHLPAQFQANVQRRHGAAAAVANGGAAHLDQSSFDASSDAAAAMFDLEADQ